MKILCYGDSNTYGWDGRSFLGDRYPPEHRWVDILGKRMNWETINEGHSGQMIPAGEGQWHCFDQLLSQLGPVDLLVVMLGSNDLLRGDPAWTVACRMEAFLRRIRLDRSRILLVAPPPMVRGQWVSSRERIDESETLGREYRALSERLGICFADAGDWEIALAFDGVHFTEEGHRAFAEKLENYLTKENEYAGNWHEST